MTAHATPQPSERTRSFTTLSGEPVEEVYTQPADPAALGLPG